MGQQAAGEAATPPHSAVAEQSVLGALLIDNAAWEVVDPLLRPSDFYDPLHGLIYRTIGEIIAALRAADVVTVVERGQFDFEYVNALAASVPSARSVVAYAEFVLEASRRRALIRLGAALAEDAMHKRPAELPAAALVDRAVTALLSLIEQGQGSEPRDMPDVLVAFLDDLQERADGRHLAFSTGLADVDRLTGGGGRRGELWVIGARPSMGKTAFVLQLCRNVGASAQVLMLTQEDSILSGAARFIAAAGGVNLADLRNPEAAPQAMWEGIAGAMDELKPLTVAMDDQTGLSLADVRRKAQQVKRRHGRLDLLVVDYLQLMEEPAENRSQSLGLIANGLKRFAKQMGCWVVLLSQLNREADKRSGPPQMSDLRDSGDIEGAADLIGMLHRDYMRSPTVENKHFAELHICKQKNGPTDTIKLHFDGALQRFGNWDGPAPMRRGGRGEG